MSVPHIDLSKARELVHKALAARGPSYVYENPPLTPDGDTNEDSCFYVHHAGLWDQGDESAPTKAVPGCLVGYALHEAGVPLEVLRNVGDEAEDGAMDARELLNALQLRGSLVPTADAVGYMRHAQWRQDRGDSWGVAIRKADERYGCN